MTRVRGTAVVSLVSVLLAACSGGEPLPNREAVDPLTMLYSGSSFVGAGDFAKVRVDLPANDADVPGWPHAVVKIWKGSAPQVLERVTIHNSADDAEEFFRDHDPRRESLELLYPDTLVGKSEPYAASGDPDSSQVYCDHLSPTRAGQCDGWTWWARFGQYTVKIQAGGGPGEHNIAREDFDRVIDLAAGHVGQELGPPIRQ